MKTFVIVSLLALLSSCARPSPLQAQTTRYTDGSLGSNCIGTYNPTAAVGSRCSGGTAIAYTTVNGGMANTASGDILQVRGASGSFNGIYNERINNTFGTIINSGSDDTHRTIIKNYQSEVVWLQYNPSCGACAGVNGNSIADKSYVTIDGINVDNQFITPISGTPPLTTNASGAIWRVDDNTVGSLLTHHITLTSTIPNTRVPWKNASGGFGGGSGACTGCIVSHAEIFNMYDNVPAVMNGVNHGGYGSYVCYISATFEDLY